MKFLDLAEKVLTEEQRPLSPAEIWSIAVAKGLNLKLKFREGKTPAQTLYSAIFNDESRNPETVFVKIAEAPNRYYLKELAPPEKLPGLEKLASKEPALSTRKHDYNESDLHQFLAFFVYSKFSALSKTIRAAAGAKVEFGEWVHPDMICVYYPVDWRDEVRELNQAISGTLIKLYSFEIKKQLDFSNLREAFFQAVSNSSWANEGYLVAAEVSDDEDFLSELRRLSASFGIGIIKLDIEEPNSSEVLVPAAKKTVLDWDALDKLAMNNDVKKLLTRIKIDGEGRPTQIVKVLYDPIPTVEELPKLLSSVHRRT